MSLGKPIGGGVDDSLLHLGTCPADANAEDSIFVHTHMLHVEYMSVYINYIHIHVYIYIYIHYLYIYIYKYVGVFTYNPGSFMG